MSWGCRNRGALLPHWGRQHAYTADRWVYVPGRWCLQLISNRRRHGFAVCDAVSIGTGWGGQLMTGVNLWGDVVLSPRSSLVCYVGVLCVSFLQTNISQRVLHPCGNTRAWRRYFAVPRILLHIVMLKRRLIKNAFRFQITTDWPSVWKYSSFEHYQIVHWTADNFQIKLWINDLDKLVVKSESNLLYCRSSRSFTGNTTDLLAWGFRTSPWGPHYRLFRCLKRTIICHHVAECGTPLSDSHMAASFVKRYAAIQLV